MMDWALLRNMKIGTATKIVLIKGRQIALTKLETSHFINAIVLAVKPTVATRILMNTAIEVPNMFHHKVNG